MAGERNRLVVGIVLALMGGCDSDDEAPAAAGGPMAELTPIVQAPMEPSRPAPPPVAQVAPPVADLPNTGVAPRRRARRRPLPAFVTGVSGKPPRPNAAAGPSVSEPEVRYQPVLRGGPRWNGQRQGVGRVTFR